MKREKSFFGTSFGWGACGFLLAVLAFSACSPPPAKSALSGWKGETMGTTYQVQLVAEGLTPGKLNTLRTRVEAELVAVNEAMSTWLPESEISRFNRMEAGEGLEVSDRFRDVLDAAKDLHRDTGGAFDPTLGPLVDLWGFGAEDTEGEAPSADAIHAALSKVGMRHIALEEGKLRKAVAGVELNVSAIAKGYGVDRVLELLEGEGLDNIYVEIGGEVACRGVNGRGTPWILGIQTPQADAKESAYRKVALENRALATSGDYRNFRESDGPRRHHLLDPRTGSPTSHSLASVSVLAGDCMTADAVATALYVMGTAEGMDWLAERPEVQALFIDRTETGYRLTATGGFEKAMVGME